MTLYILLVLMFASLYLVSAKEETAWHNQSLEVRKRLLIGFAVLLILLQSLRSHTVGGDLFDKYEGYYSIFGTMKWSQIIHYNDHEIGYVVFNKLAFIISNGNLQFLLFCISLCYHCSLFRLFYKYSKNIFLSIFLYIATSGFNTSMNELRSVLALSIVLYAIPFLFERKRFRFFLFVVVSSLFHRTSICFLYILVFTLIQNITIIVWINIIAAVVLYFSFGIIRNIISSILPRYAAYFLDINRTGGGEFLLILIILICFTVLFFTDKTDFLKEEIRVSTIILVCSSSLQVFSLYINFFSRIVSEMFGISIPILLPYFLIDNRLSGSDKVVLITFVILGFLLLYLHSLIVDGSLTVPYRFFFQ